MEQKKYKIAVVKGARLKNHINTLETRVSASVWMIIIYFWMIITTPRIRFPILGTMQAEKIVIACLILSLFLQKKIHFKVEGVSAYFMLLFVWMLFSYVLSDYYGLPYTDFWFEKYWKLILVFVLLIMSMNSMAQIKHYITGIALIYFLYQLHSWYDYVNGGSYIYTMGIKRIIGVWSGGGIGSANAFALLATIAVPFVIFVFRSYTGKKERVLAGFYLVLCCGSIIFSGTRGALVTLLLFLGVMYGKKNLKVITYFIGLMLIIFMFLPSEIQRRYTDLIFVDETDENLSTTDEIAIQSGESRLEGLVDGFNMALAKPVFGFGPGSSPVARSNVRKIDYDNVRIEDRMNLQLHSLYGQLLGELGIGGFIIFLILNLKFYRQLKNLPIKAKTFKLDLTVEEENIRHLLLSSILIMMIYGLFSHTLYRYYWIIIYAIQCAFILAMDRKFSSVK